MNKIKDTIKEFIRFTICGGIATLIDFVVFGIVIYLISPDKFDYNLIKSITANRDLIAVNSVLLGTAIGFSIGLIVNYIISITFVYNNKEKGKSIKGAINFAILSIIGLFLNVLLMKIAFELIGLNHWISKIIVTAIVFIYNYLSKKFLIFNRKRKSESN